MKSVTSISGGQSSAYVAANYPSDYLVFALVTVKDKSVMYPDAGVRQQISDRIGREFVGTVEDDVIISTVLDLEQHLGQAIHWVAGKPFEDLRKNSLPNITWRHCTELMKIKPMFEWWRRVIGEPVEMRIGFRAGEEQRAQRMLDACDSHGLRAYRKTPWQKPVFPMIDQGIKRDQVVAYWSDKAVRFAAQNNCVGCFHRNPLVLRKMFDLHPEKMQWFANMEKAKGARWKSEVTYEQIKQHRLQAEINFEDWGCDSGHCGL
jgi:hypothetical protein